MGIFLAFIQLDLKDRHLRLSLQIQVQLAGYIDDWAPGEVDPLWFLLGTEYTASVCFPCSSLFTMEFGF